MTIEFNFTRRTITIATRKACGYSRVCRQWRYLLASPGLRHAWRRLLDKVSLSHAHGNSLP